MSQRAAKRRRRKAPIVKKRKASKVVENDVEESEEDSETKDDNGVPQTARRSVPFRPGARITNSAINKPPIVTMCKASTVIENDARKDSDPISQPMSAQEESNPSVDLQSVYSKAQQILDEIGAEIEQSKAATPSIQTLTLERSQNQSIDAVFDNVTMTFEPIRLSHKIPRTLMIAGYPVAPRPGQNQMPSVGEYSRRENAVQTGQLEKLKNIVTDRRIGFENQVTELEIEDSDSDEPIEIYWSILPAPVSNSDVSMFQSRPTVPSYPAAVRSNSSKAYFPRRRPLYRGGGQFSQQRPFNYGHGFGFYAEEPRRSQTNYADLDDPQW